MSDVDAKGSFDLTGGPVWHVRACLRRASFWKDFRRNIEIWLDEWTPHARELVLIGPSAGWCLPEQVLKRFSVIHAMDPDPFASVLFRFMHPHLRLGDWSRGDFFVEGPSFLQRHSEAAVLFCNMLGQRRYVNRDIAQVEREIADVKTLLRGREWASFHDLLSGEGLAAMPMQHLSAAPDHATLLSTLNLSGEWLDHLTRDVFVRTQPRRIIPWQFAKGRLHLVEAGYVRA